MLFIHGCKTEQDSEFLFRFGVIESAKGRKQKMKNKMRRDVTFPFCHVFY